LICLTGSELTRGETQDLNGCFLAAELTALGVRVDEVRTLPDDPELLARGFREAMERAEIVLISGGLGPTADDHTVAVLARVLGRSVVRDPEAQRRMRERALRRVGSDDQIPANFYKQAEVLEGSTVLLNPVGLAPGCLLETARGIVATLPGVPRELEAMFREVFAPELGRRFPLRPPRILRAKVMGLGESWAEARIQKLGIDFERAEYGISARPGELLIKFVAQDPRHHAYLDDVRDRLVREFGEDLLLLPEGLFTGSGDRVEVEHSRLVHGLLLGSGHTLATAESSTGGLVAKLLTDNAGSSTYFRGAAVTYSNDAKRDLLGVGEGLLAAHGAVSEEVALAMSLGARRRFRADLALAVTGIAGPGGGSAEKPVGLVYIALAGPPSPSHDRDAPEAEVRVERHVFPGGRETVRLQSATRALDLVRRWIERRRSGGP
jgi:nicotinamide-nucleotide amidase